MFAIKFLRLPWVFTGLLHLVVISAQVTAQQPVLIREVWDWNDDPKWEQMPFSCRIAVAEQQPRGRGWLRFEYEIKSEQTGGTYIFNPFLDQRQEIRTCLFLIFDENKSFLGLGNQSTAGSFMGPSPHDWIRLPKGASVKHAIDLAIDAQPLHPRAAALRPGKYYLQLAFKQNTTVQPAADDRKDPIWREFVAKFRGGEWKRDFVRSNPVDFEVKE